MSRFVLFVPGMAVAAVLAGGCESRMTDASIRMISVEEVRHLTEKAAEGDSEAVLLIDARPASHYAEIHLPGAVNIPLQQIDPERERDPRIRRYENLVVYGDDPASATARALTKRLMSTGYEGVRMFAGGLAEWRARGYPLEEPTPASTPATPPAQEETPASGPASE